MREPLSPFSTELQRLLDAERHRPPAPATAKASVAAAIEALTGGEGLGLGAAPSNGPGTKPDSSTDPSQGVTNASNGSRAMSGLPWKYAGPALGAALVLGGAAGAWLGTQIGPPRSSASGGAVQSSRASLHSSAGNAAPSLGSPRAPILTAPSAAASGLPVSAELTGRDASPSLSATGSGAERTNHESRSRATLAAERLLVDAARSALARGDGPAALKALGQHEKQFPGGYLAEERAALAIQALVAAGRMREAGERAGQFRRRYPTSFLLPVVDKAVGASP